MSLRTVFLTCLTWVVALSAGTVPMLGSAAGVETTMVSSFDHDSPAAATTPSANTRAAVPSGDQASATGLRSSTSEIGSSLATKAGTSIVKYDADFAIGQLTSRGAKASDLTRLAESQAWRRVQNPNGPIKYLDDGGVQRLTLKSGSARAPGSNFPHVEIRNAAGRRVDPYGNPVTRRSPGNHTRIEWDLP